MPHGPLRRLPQHKVVAGVCAGLAVYLGIDVVLVRILWVVLTLVSLGAGLIGYLLLWIFVPEA